MTVLFCDVAGSTALGERLDPEALRLILASYFERMKAIVEYHGGTVEKFIGDAVMAVFGVPVLHEDDALRALRAAVEMREAFPELGIQGRIGVTTGEVVTGTEERLATGDAVNVAARLEQAAEPGEILIGEETYRLTRDAAVVDVLEPRTLKGKAGPVAAHRLISVHGTEGFLRNTSGTMVGRSRELRQLASVWERATSERACQLFTVLGAAGVGKSRLSAEFLAALDDTLVVRGRCLPYGEGITYWPVVEIVKQLPEVDVDPARRRRRRAPRQSEARHLERGDRLGVPQATRSGRPGSSSACSTTSIGARRPSSTWWSTSPISPATRRSCCSAWRGRTSSTAGQAGAAARSMPRRCCSSRSRLPRRRF